MMLVKPLKSCLFSLSTAEHVIKRAYGKWKKMSRTRVPKNQVRRYLFQLYCQTYLY